MRIALVTGVNSDKKPYMVRDNVSCISFSSYNSEFTSSEGYSKFKRAKAYADKIISKKGRVDLNKCNLEKLEGLQHGIEIFDGLNVKQIALLYNHFGLLAAYRGCTNNCSHCFVEAVPPAALKQKYELQALPWEDFTKMLDGFAQFSNRLGYKSNQSPMRPPAIGFFFDADCMEVVLHDKNGKSYDVVDMTKEMKNKIGQLTFFDTAGWNPKNQVLQKRAEKMVDFIKAEQSDLKNAHFFRVNLSLNPFHAMNTRFAQLKNTNPDKAKLYREAYTTRMANMFYTFTPLFNDSRFRVLNRALREDLECDETFKFSGHKKLIDEIIVKLISRYREVGMSDDVIKMHINALSKHTDKIDTNILAPIGRLKNFFSSDSEFIKRGEDIDFKFAKDPLKHFENYHSLLYMDTNGQVFIHEQEHKYLTDIKLNFSVKDKKTPPLLKESSCILTTDEIRNRLNSPKIKFKKIFIKSKFAINRFIRKLLKTTKL